MKKSSQKIARSALPTSRCRCTCSSDVCEFWRERVAGLSGFNIKIQGLWAITLDGERFFTGCHSVKCMSFDAAQRFADELFQSEFLRGVPEFILVHHRPGVALKASVADKERISSVILAGRARKTELLDCLLLSEPHAAHPSGCLPMRKIRGFSAQNPFVKPSKKARQTSAELEAVK